MRIRTMGPLALTLLAVSAAVAEEEFDPAARAKTIARFIDEQTIAVAHVDLTRVKIGPLVDTVVELIPEAVEHQQEAKAGMNALHAALLQAAGKDVYFLFSLADVDYSREPLPLLIVPLGAADEAALTLLLESSPYEVKRRLGDVFFAGSRRALERLTELKPDARPELAQAFEAAGDTAAQVLLLPPKYTRRVIEEMMPELPEQIGGGSSRIVTRGLTWAAVGVDLPPQMALRLVVQSEDQQTASALREKWLALYQLAGSQKEVRQVAPDFDKLVALLTPAAEDDRLTLLLNQQDGGIASVLALLKPPLQEARRRAQRATAINHLKQIALAMHNHHSALGHFPAIASYDADGKPLLSWRVQVLPYHEHGNLYNQFHFDESWDSEHNRKLIEKMPAIYRSPASKLKEKGRTSYLLPVGNQTAFSGREGTTLKEITDGTVHTIMVVEVDDEQAVIWTKPEDLPFDPKNPAKGLGGLFPGGFNAAFCDASVHFLNNTISPDTLRALFTRAGGEVVSWKDGKFQVAEHK